MEISKVPPADVPAAGAGPASATGPATATGPAGAAEQGSRAPVNIVPVADRVDIRPLDISAALQILLAEVRTALDLPPDVTPAPTPVQAARALVEMFLQAVPEDSISAPAWIEGMARVETAMLSSMERATSLVALWREVPAAVVDSVTETRALFLLALGPDRQNPLWLRPEWIDLAPRFQRFRRRRNARRRLTDPDYSPGSHDLTEAE